MEQEGTISSNFSSNITHQDRFKLLFGLYLECFFSLFTLKLKFERRLWRNFSLIKIRIFNFPYYSSSTFSGSPRLRSFVSQDLSIDSPSKIIFKHFFFFLHQNCRIIVLPTILLQPPRIKKGKRIEKCLNRSNPSQKESN